MIVYDGGTDLPDLGSVEFYVPQYMSGDQVLAVMSRMPKLQVVQTLTAGVDNVWPYLPDGVMLCNARGVHDASTAELVVGLTIAALRRIPDFVRAQARGEWLSGRFEALADKRVLIIGYGSVGRAVERRFAGFEVEVIRVARHAREGVEPFERLGDLLPLADVVVLVCPLTDETRGMVDEAFLARMHDGALLVNAARGPVVVTDALLAEVRTGRLLAALDVTDPEPLPAGHELWRASGVLISPHVGGNTTAFLPRAYRLVSAQLARWADGDPLENVISRPSTLGA
ncbi:MAG: 2-hydroxyacid dehydrogenase [Candidatus Nanopelagicales bacterium]